MANPQKARIAESRTDVGARVVPASASAREGTVPAEKIAVRAYEIWQASGCQHGKHEEHWYTAEREIQARPARSR
jgi:hypothetical protein